MHVFALDFASNDHLPLSSHIFTPKNSDFLQYIDNYSQINSIDEYRLYVITYA